MKRSVDRFRRVCIHMTTHKFTHNTSKRSLNTQTDIHFSVLCFGGYSLAAVLWLGFTPTEVSR